MKIRIMMLLILCFSISVYAENTIEEDSASLHPLLDEVHIIHQDDNARYRALIYRGGYEHISAYLLIQKFSVDYNGLNAPYKLISTVSFSEINNIYNFEIESIQNSKNGFIIELNAVHSYIYEETKITVLLSEDMQYRILSGLVEL